MKNAKLFLSLALFSAVVAGAFTNKAPKTTLTTSPGYIKQSGTCVYKNECTIQLNKQLCTVTNTGGARVFGMDPNDCTIDLWRVN